MSGENVLTLRSERNFRRVYCNGRSYVSFCVVVYVKNNFGKMTRLGITASKKVGNAVKRNRARRVIREACLDYLRGGSLGGFDIVIVARAKTASVKSYVVKENLVRLFEKAGLKLSVR